MEWTKEKVIKKLEDINKKGFIPVPENMFRKDDGVVGQILEREFGLKENNLRMADLGNFELKGKRIRKRGSSMLTLFHRVPSSGMTPVQIFNRFGYIRKSNRSEVIKKKLFTTIRGDRINSLGFVLKAQSENKICLYHLDEHLSTWDLSEADKINSTILAFAETRGAVNSKDELFHFTKAFLLSGAKSLAEAIRAGAVVMDLCIDQPADGSKGVHERGPHIRISTKKLGSLFSQVEEIL